MLDEAGLCASLHSVSTMPVELKVLFAGCDEFDEFAIFFVRFPLADEFSHSTVGVLDVSAVLLVVLLCLDVGQYSCLRNFVAMNAVCSSSSTFLMQDAWLCYLAFVFQQPNRESDNALTIRSSYRSRA